MKYNFYDNDYYITHASNYMTHVYDNGPKSIFTLIDCEH